MDVIQQLQGSRPMVVHLFDEVVKTIPDGAHLKKLTQKGAGITLIGQAQSNARVSSYMRNIESSQWLNKPNLQVITNKNAKGDGLNSFTLVAMQVSPAKESGATKSGKTRKQAGQ